MPYEVGQKLLIKIDSKTYEGEFFKENHSSLVINKVSLYPSKKNYSPSMTFYKPEIVDIKSVDEVSPETNGMNGVLKNSIKVSDVEFDRLKSMTHDYIYMATVDNRYISAIKYLNSCESISVTSVGGGCGRTSKIKLLIVASREQIYIFDIDSFKNICCELRTLLENKSIRKIVHDCRGLSDCLYHNHQIKLENVFDTQVADFMLQKNLSKEGMPRNFRSLQECLTHYLNFPISLFENPKSNLHPWSESTTSKNIKRKAALNVVYLITLYGVLEKEMLKTFYSTIDLCLNIARVSDNAHCAARYITSEIPNEILELNI